VFLKWKIGPKLIFTTLVEAPMIYTFLKHKYRCLHACVCMYTGICRHIGR